MKKRETRGTGTLIRRIIIGGWVGAALVMVVLLPIGLVLLVLIGRAEHVLDVYDQPLVLGLAPRALVDFTLRAVFLLLVALMIVAFLYYAISGNSAASPQRRFRLWLGLALAVAAAVFFVAVALFNLHVPVPPHTQMLLSYITIGLLLAAAFCAFPAITSAESFAPSSAKSAFATSPWPTILLGTLTLSVGSIVTLQNYRPLTWDIEPTANMFKGMIAAAWGLGCYVSCLVYWYLPRRRMSALRRPQSDTPRP